MPERDFLHDPQGCHLLVVVVGHHNPELQYRTTTFVVVTERTRETTMHKVIWILVEADEEPSAVAAATDAFERFLQYDSDKANPNSHMDYCSPMVSGSTVAGSDRWTAFKDEPLAAPLDSEQGQEWFEEAKKFTMQTFASNLGQLITQFDEDGSAGAFQSFIEHVRELASEEGSTSAPYGNKDELAEEHGTFLEAVMDSFGRYYASCLNDNDPHEAFLFDNRRYEDSLLVASCPSDYDWVDETTEEVGAENTWLVPLDVHF